jgi:hypothetical protein
VTRGLPEVLRFVDSSYFLALDVFTLQQRDGEQPENDG